MNTVKNKTIMIIAGEPSGDVHGAHLVNAIKKKTPDLTFFGIGGDSLKAVGVKIVVHADKLSVMGFTEVFIKIPLILNCLKIAKQTLVNKKPDLLILIDFPDFNLRMAAFAKKQGVKVLYYISPQVWAWRSGRVKKIAKIVDHLAVILPFEKKYYKSHDIAVTYVGHPLMDNYLCKEKNNSLKNRDNKNIVGLFPGSRKSEIETLLPIMLNTCIIIAKNIGKTEFLLSVAPSTDKGMMLAAVRPYKGMIDIKLISEKADKVLNRSTLCIAVSGTVTLEAAILETPMIIIYKCSTINYFLGKILANIKHIGLANIIADKTIVPELIQKDATPKKIAKEACRLLSDQKALNKTAADLLKVRIALGEPGASDKTANIAISLIKKTDKI